MLFNEQAFLFYFLPICLSGFWILRFKLKCTNISYFWCLLCSFFFYGFHGWYHLPLLISSILTNYFLGIIIEKKKDSRVCLLIMWLGIVVNLGVLGIFKYSDFFLGVVSTECFFGLALPLAISFFTFQQVAYLVDLRRGEISSPSLLSYAFFISFFPQLIAGPIVRCQQLIPQIKEKATLGLRRKDFWCGLCLFAMGLFKKTYFADGIRPLAEGIFDAAHEGTILSFTEAWIGGLSFGMQIYFDFSAYSDMAIGLGLLFGLSLPVNFNSPYKATSLIDFWRRWHITLSEFLRDYLYKPLGGNRCGVSRGIINVLLVMALGGLWHGAAWTFVAWGVFHGILIGFNHLLRAMRSKFPSPKTSFLAWPSRLTVFLVVTISWIYFRCQDLSTAWEMISSMIGMNGFDLPRSFGLDANLSYVRFEGLLPNRIAELQLVPVLGFLILFVWFAPNSFNLLNYNSDESKRKQPSLPVVFVCGVLLFFGIKASFEQITLEFIYFRF